MESDSVNTLCQEIITLLDDKKAQDVLVIDLTARSFLADRFVIATGLSSRQVGALGDHLYRFFKSKGLSPSLEGSQQCDWVVVDSGEIIVHLFRPEVREFYQLEKIWLS